MAKTIVITGASDGIGAAAARRLHRNGHRVVVVGRSVDKTAAIARELSADHYTADFANLAEVRALAAELDRVYPRIDVLANNAGGIFGADAKTCDGFEITFQVNHLAPFLLTNLLLDKLSDCNAAIIQTSSVGARAFGRLDLTNLQHDRGFTPLRAYGSAKLANILFTKELHQRHGSRGIATAAFHPGLVATSFAANTVSLMRRVYSSRVGRAFLTSPDQGADQLVWLAEGTPGTDWASGAYYEKHRPAKRVNPQVLDANLARRLWDHSAELIGD